MFSEKDAEVIELGEIKISRSWTNLYIKFRFTNGKEYWMYYSEHENKPLRISQIRKFISGVFKIGSKFTLNYKIVQSNNKSNKLAIVSLSNHVN